MSGQGKFDVCDRNLGLLQEMINRDAESYEEEFMEQFQHYLQAMKLLALQPSQHRMDLQPLLELVVFLSSVAWHYPKSAVEFAKSLLAILRQHGTGLVPEVRLSFCKGLVILRNRRIISALEVLEVFFELVRCQDKKLRQFIFGSTMAILKKLNSGRRDPKLYSKIQQFFFLKLKDSHAIVARTAQLVLVSSFRKGYWRDGKTSNALAECCFSKFPRIQVASMKFFLGSAKDEEGVEESDSESDIENAEDQKTIKEVMCAFRAAKKTRKRQKNFEKAKKLVSKEKKKKEGTWKLCNLLAMQLIFDPQTFADRLFSQLESKRNEKFDIRMLQIALCARMIGIHKLQTLGFYSYLHRYLQPKQREVTRILLYAAQACHSLVPPDVVQLLVRVIAQNFVTDINSPEAITVGLNAVREIFVNCPLAATEELARDLCEYRSYKNKNVSMAARGIITLFRSVNPKLLKKKDRGRPTESMKEIDPIEFGSNTAKSFVPGAECLFEFRKESEEITDDNADDGGEDSEELSMDFSTDDGEEDESDGLEEDEGSCSDSDKKTENVMELEEKKVEESENNEQESAIEEGAKQLSKTEEKAVERIENTSGGPSPKKKSKVHFAKGTKEFEESEGTVERAQTISSSRILTQEEFRKINSYQIKKKFATKKQILGAVKRSNDDEKLVEELDELENRQSEGDGLPKLKDIENFHKRVRKATKEERMEKVREGREGKRDFGKPKKKGPHVGRTNRELAKRKSYQMVRQKIRGKNRQRSFRDQQKSLRSYLLRQAGKKIV
ncbi:hypothetical protein AB6A40_003105 [Gnathostoma spinigerum]|uniref:Protein SDA1 n=1 Tax=Gnathostoma spinigerum TaxID=75299 RepID=A0ABD6EB25_9BILA